MQGIPRCKAPTGGVRRYRQVRSCKGLGGVREDIVARVERQLEDIATAWTDASRDVLEALAWFQVKDPRLEPSV